MNYIIGIDEVGRGSIAGPVTVGALALPQSLNNHKLKTLTLANYVRKSSSLFAMKSSRSFRDIPLRDSKKLSAKHRELWFNYIKNHPKISYAVAHVQPSVIDRINISKAANRAALKALQKLLLNKEFSPKADPPLAERIKNNVKIYLDGGLYLEKKHNTQNSKMITNKKKSTVLVKFKPNIKLHAKTIVRGDEKIKAVMLASIVAKVTRDKLMTRLHKKYPKYGFLKHKGYGTRAHMAAVKRYGPSQKHRVTFI